MSILPDVPRLPTLRGKIADAFFVLLSICSRFGFVIGGLIGAVFHGFVGFLIGLAIGAIVGFCLGRSLGLRGRNLTRGYHLRMHERGLGKQAGWLEAIVELIRGNRLSMLQCRNIACAYAEAARQLQSYDSDEERKNIILARNESILEAVYGETVRREDCS